MKPLIGITTFRSKNKDDHPIVALMQSYVDAVGEAGGVPVLIPSSIGDGWETVYRRLDGILFSGGGDIALEEYSGDPHPRVYGLEPQRDFIEINLLKASAEEGKPFLGICRGCQVLNVAMGGTLYTHLRDQLPNSLEHDYPSNLRTVLVHEVKLEVGSRIAEIMDNPIVRVNSLHHQGLKMIAPALRGSGYSPDGLVEAVELPNHPFGIGVQWHPEWLTDQISNRNLFRKFIDAAGDGHE